MEYKKLLVKYGADISEAERGLAQVNSKVEETNRSMQDKFGALTGGLKQVGMAMTAAVTLPVALAGKSALDAAVRFDSLERGLTAIMGSGAAARTEMERLREVAKLPGLGYEEAIRGATALQAAGLNAREASDALKGFGNALATVGKGKADLEGVQIALAQILSKGKVQGDEIIQLMERVPQMGQIMRKAFGTADTEVLKKMGVDARTFVNTVTAELLKLPTVTGGLQNSLENMQDAMNRAAAAMGKAFAPAIEKIAGWIERLGNWLDSLSVSQRQWIGGIALAAAALGPLLMLASQFANVLTAWRLGQLALTGQILATAAAETAEAAAEGAETVATQAATAADLRRIGAQVALREALAGTAFAMVAETEATVANTAAKTTSLAVLGSTLLVWAAVAAAVAVAIWSVKRTYDEFVGWLHDKEEAAKKRKDADYGTRTAQDYVDNVKRTGRPGEIRARDERSAAAARQMFEQSAAPAFDANALAAKEEAEKRAKLLVEQRKTESETWALRVKLTRDAFAAERAEAWVTRVNALRDIDERARTEKLSAVDVAAFKRKVDAEYAVAARDINQRQAEQAKQTAEEQARRAREAQEKAVEAGLKRWDTWATEYGAGAETKALGFDAVGDKISAAMARAKGALVEGIVGLFRYAAAGENVTQRLSLLWARYHDSIRQAKDEVKKAQEEELKRNAGVVKSKIDDVRREKEEKLNAAREAARAEIESKRQSIGWTGLADVWKNAMVAGQREQFGPEERGRRLGVGRRSSDSAPYTADEIVKAVATLKREQETSNRTLKDIAGYLRPSYAEAR